MLSAPAHQVYANCKTSVRELHIRFPNVLFVKEIGQARRTHIRSLVRAGRPTGEDCRDRWTARFEATCGSLDRSSCSISMLLCFSGEAQASEAQARSILLEEIARQQQHIAAALAKRGDAPSPFG
jgi:hypothetical protein